MSIFIKSFVWVLINKQFLQMIVLNIPVKVVIKRFL